MGFFNKIKYAFKSANGRMKLYDLERTYIDLIAKSNDTDKLNQDLLALFFQMSNVAWHETSAASFYSSNQVTVELFRQIYVTSMFSMNNKYIKSKNSFLTNIVLVDNPEQFSTILMAIFDNVKSGKDEFVDKALVDFLLETSFRVFKD